MNKNDIGNNARVIWRMLEEYGVMGINEIVNYRPILANYRPKNSVFWH